MDSPPRQGAALTNFDQSIDFSLPTIHELCVRVIRASTLTFTTTACLDSSYWFAFLYTSASECCGFPIKGSPRGLSSIFVGMDLKRNQFETRVATLELMVVTERARPKPNEDEIEKLEKELAATKSALQKYNEENP